MTMVIKLVEMDSTMKDEHVDIGWEFSVMIPIRGASDVMHSGEEVG